jgi:hypothetical protein
MIVVVVAPAIAVSIMFVVPVVIMLEAATVSIPVTVVEVAPFPAWSYPACPAVGWQSPITNSHPPRYSQGPERPA